MLSWNTCCGYTTKVKGIYFDEEGLYVTLVQVTVLNRRVHHLAAVSVAFMVYGGWIPNKWRLEDVVMLVFGYGYHYSWTVTVFVAYERLSTCCCFRSHGRNAGTESVVHQLEQEYTPLGISLKTVWFRNWVRGWYCQRMMIALLIVQRLSWEVYMIYNVIWCYDVEVGDQWKEFIHFTSPVVMLLIGDQHVEHLLSCVDVVVQWGVAGLRT